MTQHDVIVVGAGLAGLQAATDLVAAGRDVLVIDDILDTGQTLVRIRDIITKLEPRSLKFSVFLEKEIPHHENFRADYVAFHIPNKFVVGYGLDYLERYRNLPYVGTLKPAVVAAQLGIPGKAITGAATADGNPILWKNRAYADRAAAALKITSKDLIAMKLADEATAPEALLSSSEDVSLMPPPPSRW